MPIYRPLVPNAHSDSPQVLSGNGLELSGGEFSLKELAKGVGQAANVAMPLAQAFGVTGADQATAVNNALQGNGFGKGTQKKALAIAKKGARVAGKLIGEFGDEKPKRKKNTGKKAASMDYAADHDHRATCAEPLYRRRALCRRYRRHRLKFSRPPPAEPPA